MIERTPSTTGSTEAPPAHERPPAKTRYALPPLPPEGPKSKWRFLGWAILLGLALGAYLNWGKITPLFSAPAPAPAGKGGKKGGRGGGGNAPVVATRARRGNIDVVVTALGSVTPIYTTVLQSRVVGELMSISYKEGDLVNKGDVLMEIDPRPYQVQLEQAEGQLAKDQAALDNARVDLKRYQTLLDQNAIPEQQVATQKALVDQDAGIVKTDQGQIDSAKLNLQYCKIIAPITGRLGLRLVDPGNIIQTTTNLVVITQIDPISVIFPLPEDNLPPIYKKMRAGQQLPVEAWDHSNTQKLAAGKLVTIDNQIDQSTGTVRMRADFDNKDHELFPNQFVNVRVLQQVKTGVVLLDNAAIQRSGNNVYVFLVKPDSTVTVRDIQIGTIEGNYTEITSGLQPGDEVVMTGVDKLQEGMKVSAQVQGDKPANGGGRKGGAKGGGARQ